MSDYTGTCTTETPDDEHTRQALEQAADELVILIGLTLLRSLLSRSKWPKRVQGLVMNRLNSLIKKYSDNLGLTKDESTR